MLWERTSPKGALSAYGRIVDDAIRAIPGRYENVAIDRYVVMPNHVHMILVLKNHEPSTIVPTVSSIVQRFKRSVTDQTGFPLWQRSYFDHIIRGVDEYELTRDYIEKNPAEWEKDEFYA